MAFDDQKPVQRDIGVLLLDLPGKIAPGISQLMIAPVLMIDDGIAGEKRQRRTVIIVCFAACAAGEMMLSVIATIFTPDSAAYSTASIVSCV